MKKQDYASFVVVYSDTYWRACDVKSILCDSGIPAFLEEEEMDVRLSLPSPSELLGVVKVLVPSDLYEQSMDVLASIDFGF